MTASLAAGYYLWRERQPVREFRQGLQALENRNLVGLRTAADALEHRAGFEPHAHLLRGALRLRIGEPRAAVEDLRIAVEHDETRLLAQVLAGEALCRLKLYTEAIRTLNQALRTDPQNIEAQRWIGAAYYDMGAMDHAVQHLEKVAELKTDDPRPHRLIGLIFKDLEQYKPAVTAYQESLRRSRRQPDLQEILTELATVQVHLNQYAEARETLAECDATPEVVTLRAQCDYNAGDKPGARRLIENALKMNADCVPALTLRGTMELDAGEPSHALPPLLRAAELDPADFSVRFKLSQAYAQLGDTAQAEAQREEMDRLKKIRQEFAQLFEQALNNPADADARFRLGILSRKLKHVDLSRMWFQAALGIDPNHQPARHALKQSHTEQPVPTAASKK